MNNFTYLFRGFRLKDIAPGCCKVASLSVNGPAPCVGIFGQVIGIKIDFWN